MLAIIHAHPDQQLRLCNFVQTPVEIVVFQKQPNGSAPVLRENILAA